MSIVSLPWSDEGYAIGNKAGNYAAQVADKAADFACGLARAYPGTVIGNAASSAIEGFWNGVCKDRGGSPQSKDSGIQGGQCEGVEYWWTFSTAANPATIEADGTGAFLRSFGPLTGFRVNGILNTDTIDGVKYVDYALQLNAGSSGLVGGSAVGFEGDIPFVLTRRVDGLPDTCGDNSGGYPDSGTPPPPGWNEGTTIVNTSNNIGVTVPIVYTPVNVGISPTFNVNVGGVNVKFDLGGVTVNFNPKFQPGEPGYPGNDDKNSDDKIDIIIDDPGSGGGGFSPSDRSTLNNINNTVNNIANDIDNVNNNVSNVSNNVNNLSDKVDDLSDKIDNLPDCCDETQPGSDELDEDEKTEADEKKEENVPELKFVKIELTTLPPNSKVQFGEGSPNIYYAGWFEWIVAGFALPRQPIHFQKSIFNAPPYADGYAYTLVNGAQGRATVYKRKVTP